MTTTEFQIFAVYFSIQIPQVQLTIHVQIKLDNAV